jgi:hypothetical protein
MNNNEELSISLLKSLVLELMSRLDTKEVYLPERNLTDKFEIICKHDSFGAKFKFFIVEKQ